MSDLLEGVILSDYLLLQCISRGGVADVYRGRHTGTGNYEVAVKVFRSGYAQRPSFRDYFMTEADKIGQFEHPNILPFLEFGEGEGLLYAVTPFVPTGTLADLLSRVGGKFSALQALPIVQQLCSAVQYAHDRQVVHGNIKPSNVFVASDGRMLLSDFGIVHGYDDSQQSLTRIGWGSAEYAAPEQSLGVVRKTSDIYSLGVLLFRILTGQPPFTGNTPVEVLLKHVRHPAPSARSIDPSISDAVDGVIQMALQKRSDDRFASAEEFSQSFQAAVTVAPVASPVAKAVPSITRQLTQSQTFTTGEPQTPAPSNIAVTPVPVEPAAPSEQFDFPDVPPVFPPSSTTTPGSSGSSNGNTSKGETKKHFLLDDDDAGTHMFWSVNPVEWSPIGSEQDNDVPMTAADYLRSKPVVPEVPPEVPTSSPARKDTVKLAEKEEKPAPQENANKRERKRKNLLPILVVILLLIGLLGALLSSFLFPDPTGHTGQSAPAASTAVSTSPTASLSPTNQGKASPTVTKPTVTPTQAVQPTPTPTLAPIPTNPAISAFSCSSGAMSMDGSAYFVPAVQQLTTDYDNQCSNGVNFSFNSDESRNGLDALDSGSVDMAYSDLPSSGRSGLVDYQVGALIFAVVVNSDTQVTNLTIAQLQGIYTGRITNWSQVGGSNEPVVILSQPATSTIRAIFQSFVLHGVTQTVTGITASVSIQNLTGGITYLPLNAVPTSGAQSITINGVQASSTAVANGSYPFWTMEHLYTTQSASAVVRSFISFCFTSSGMSDLLSNALVPFKNMSVAALRSHIPSPVV
jgi:serine/threonine protein kinase